MAYRSASESESPIPAKRARHAHRIHKLVAGREADFPFLEQGNPQHERARQDWSNRARYANRYFDIVLAYVAEQFRPPS